MTVNQTIVKSVEMIKKCICRLYPRTLQKCYNQSSSFAHKIYRQRTSLSMSWKFKRNLGTKPILKWKNVKMP